MTISNQVCSSFEKTEKHELKVQWKQEGTESIGGVGQAWEMLGKAQFSPNNLKLDNAFWLESTPWLTPFSRWTS